MTWAASAVAGLGFAFCMLYVIGIRWSVNVDGQNVLVEVWIERPWL